MVVSESLFFDYLSDRFVKSAQLSISCGCDGGCSYCNRPFLEGVEVQFISKKEMKEELLQFRENGIRHIDFLDSTFLQNAEEIIQILKELEAEGVDFVFSFAVPVKTLIRNQKYLMPLKKLGLRQVTLGVVNSNAEVLQRYGQKMTEADQHYAIQILQALRIQLHLHYMMFEPQSQIEHLLHDYHFLEKNRLLGLAPFTDILTTYPDLSEDTFLGQEYRAKGIYKPADNPILPYQLVHKEVEDIFHWMLFFEWEFGVRWNQFYYLLLELRADMARHKPNWALANSGQELMFLTLNLRMMPYELFQALLNAAKTGRLEEVNDVEVRQQVEQRFYEFEDQYWRHRKSYNL